MASDATLLDEIKAEITELPTYGYRRARALVNRHRAACGAPRVNAKRVYRVMAAHALLLPKAPGRRQSSRPHEGKVAVAHSDARWCSDGFEIKCDSGQTVTATFTKDCCDREILAFRAWEGKGLPGEPVREMLIEAVEKRFGNVEGVPATHALEFLSDNGGAYIAIETRKIARQLGLKPVNTPVCSPQSNGMAESFVNTFKRDYVSRMDLADARTVLAQMAAAFEHFNEVHPHSALKMKSPREFRQHRAASSALFISSKRYIANSPCPEIRGQGHPISAGPTRSGKASGVMATARRSLSASRRSSDVCMKPP
jgi:putative transposase